MSIDTPTFKLSQAIGFQRVDEVRSLIADKALVNTLDENNDYPLSHAAERGNVEIVKLLLDAGAEVDVPDAEYGSTALMNAASRGHAAVVKMLIAAGANVRHKDKKSWTALMQGVKDRTKANLQIMQVLISAGADVNASGGAFTVLSRASGSGSPDIVGALIAAGADVNAYASFGTPLMTAIDENRADNVAVLLEHGADVALRLPADFENEELAGKTALDVARAKKAKKIIALLEAPVAKAKPQTAAKKPAETKAPAVSESWKAIDAWLKVNAPDLKKILNKAATEKKLADLEKLIQAKLPTGFRESLRIHDGQKYAEGDLVPPLNDGEEGCFLLASADIAKEWQNWKKLHDMGEFVGQESGPDKGVSDAWWNPGWIPFASNGGGDSLCIDLAPTKDGVVGQVITMSHEDSKRELLATSYKQWLAELASALDGAPRE